MACQGKKTAENTPSTASETENNIAVLTEKQAQTAGIVVGKTTLRNLSKVLKSNGMIEIPPQNLVSISATMGGFVRQTEMLQGMRVRKGQVLAIIENPDFIPIQQEYLETQSKLSFAEQENKRQAELSKENVTAQKTYQQANTDMRVLKARLLGLEQRLKVAGIDLEQLQKGVIVTKVPIVSPVSGSVTGVNVNLGKYVNPTDVMFELVDTDHLHVELSVFEQDLPLVKLGQLVRFRVNNNPREDLAKVYLINQKINDDRTVRVHCHLIKDDPTLLPQNFVKAIIELGNQPSEALPDEAIVGFEGKFYVFVENSTYHYEMVEINKGVSENGFTAINFLEKITKKSPNIVLKGAYKLLAKLKNTEEE